VPPNDFDTSEYVEETCDRPNTVKRIIGGMEYIIVASNAENAPPPKNIKTGTR
jgi:hypothetical protein